MKKIALISVYNKQGIVAFAKNLIKLGYDIWSSGGTAKALLEAGVPVVDVATLVGKPILGHKVVTLSRQIHAGLLCDLNNPTELAELEAEGILPIHLMCGDFYPLENAIAELKTFDEIVGLTDIGGPTMISSAAKGARIVIANAEQRTPVIEWLEKGKPNEKDFLRELQARADFTVAVYRMLSANYHSEGNYVGNFYRKTMDLRYGENPHQLNCSLLETLKGNDSLAIKEFKQIEGAAPSSTNLTDLSAAVNVLNLIALTLKKNGVWDDDDRLAVVVKHGTPCGLGYSRGNIGDALKNMIAGEPQSAFGGAVVTNFMITEESAVLLKTHLLQEGQKRVYDLVAVPEISSGAVELLARKDDKCRIFENSRLHYIHDIPMPIEQVRRQVRGGEVVYDAPKIIFNLKATDCNMENSRESLHSVTIIDLCIAHAVCAISKSNTIAFVKDGILLANASGQQSRVHCIKLAIAKMNEFHPGTTGFVVASDSFFPFEDGPQLLIDAKAGIVFATSGSLRFEKVSKLFTDNDVVFITVPDIDGRLFNGHVG